MKFLLTIIFCLSCIVTFAQNTKLNNKKIKKLYHIGIPMDSVNISSPNNRYLLNEIITKHKKRTKNTVISTALLGVGLIGVGQGISHLIKGSAENGITMVLAGSVSFLLSKPFKNIAKKREEERDALMPRFINY